MTDPNFGAILDRPSGEIKRPPPLPVGTYVWLIKGLPRMDKSARKQTEFVEFNCVPVEPQDDVDEEDLEAVGGIAGLSEKPHSLTFYLTDKSAYRLVEFMVNDLQIDNKPDENGVGQKPSREMLSETNGCQFLGTIKHTPSEDGKAVYSNIVSTAPVD